MLAVIPMCSLSNIHSGTGTIKYMTFEDGFYIIASDRGEAYDLINDEDYPSFLKDGLRVRFCVKVPEEWVSFHECGNPAEILSIGEL